jgi:Cu-Zn family superoxide dismutase
MKKLLLPVLAALSLVSCGDDEPQSAVVELKPTEGNDVYGRVAFTPYKGGVLIVAEVHNLTPGQHGFHIHEFGDCSAPDGSSAGGHYNPYNKPHAGPDDPDRHMGDMGNLVADVDGNATYERLDDLIELSGPNSIIGRAVIVHSGRDDLVTQPTGDAGSRVACGVIKARQKSD